MKWPFECPYCGIEYMLREEHQGKDCRCANCRKIFFVPEDLEAFTATEHFCPDCTNFSPIYADYCFLCGYSFWEKKSREPAADCLVNENIRYCYSCGRKVRPSTKYCPSCDSTLYYYIDEKKEKNKPFLCSVLNVIGGIAAVFGGFGLFCVVFSVVRGFCDPAHNIYADMSAKEISEALKNHAVAVGFLFAGLILCGISSLIARASRRW